MRPRLCAYAHVLRPLLSDRAVRIINGEQVCASYVLGHIQRFLRRAASTPLIPPLSMTRPTSPSRACGHCCTAPLESMQADGSGAAGQ